MIVFFVKSMIGLFLIAFSLQTQAANWYQVDMIVFDHLNTSEIDESWDIEQGIPDISNSIQLVSEAFIADTISLTSFQLLPQERQRIPGVYAALRNSNQYRPFAYLVWQQPELQYQRAKDIRILLNSQPVPNNHFNLIGTLKLRSGQLLHIDLDLAYFFTARDYSSLFYDVVHEEMDLSNDPISTELSGSVTMEEQKTDNRYVRLKETRRIKLNEIHYFDHPLFGVIIRVSRLAYEENQHN